MKLIDTDVLFAQMEEYYKKRAKESNMTGGRTICVTWNDAVFLIKSSSTIDAIPIDWLEEKLTNHPEIPYAVTDGINAVLDMWREENETD